jgi:hypothetical protein
VQNYDPFAAKVAMTLGEVSLKRLRKKRNKMSKPNREAFALGNK